MKPSRRDVLRLLSLASASTMMWPRRALAAAPVPKRIVFYYAGATLRQVIANGDNPATIKSWWTPGLPAGAPDPTTITMPWSTSNHSLPDIHSPLSAFQKRMLYLDGLDMRSSFADPVGAVNAHIAGATHAMTGIGRQTAGLAGGLSIDQFIANAINTPKPLTALPSLELAISSDAYPYENEAQQSENSPLYAAAGQPISLATNPQHAYARLLPNGPNTGDAEAQARLAAQIKRQKGVLEFSAKRFSSVSAKLGPLDRARLDAHASSIRDLNNRLSLPMPSACVEPTQASVIGQVQGQQYGSKSFKAHTDVMYQLAQVALACDLTRVVSIIGGEIPPERYGYTPGMSGTSDFHDMCHKTNGINAPLADDVVAINTVKAAHVAEAELLAQFLTGLDSMLEADGTTLLDNTLVVWCHQLGAHDHSLQYLPYVLFGGLCGAVKTGRYVRYPRVADKSLWPIYSVGPAHNDLFVTLANLMGISTNTFGDPNICRGALPGLT